MTRYVAESSVASQCLISLLSSTISIECFLYPLSSFFKHAVIRKNSYEVPAIFDLLAKTGNIEEHMMYNTYNMGIGMMLAVDSAKADEAIRILQAAGESAYIVGEITDGEKGITIQ